MLRVEQAHFGAGVHAIAVWDQGWSSYNNFYIIDRPDGLTLVDTGKPGHLEALHKALAELGHRPEDVDFLVATHGHTDHVGCAGTLTGAQRAIHRLERASLPQWQQQLFPVDLPDAGTWAGLSVRLLPPFHTPGSVALLDARSGALFTGDHWSFFGDQLLPEGLVGPGDDLRRSAMRQVDEWRDRLRRRPNLHEPDPAMLNFARGLKELASMMPAEYLCTGHGPVLRGDIGAFLADLLERSEWH